MSDSVITIENLSKKYIIRHANGRHRDDGLRHVLQDAALAPWRWLRKAAGSSAANGNGSSHLPAPRSLHPAPPSEDFWALRDVSLELKEGEVIGIIGRNGAGKSTLLKILSRITEPTGGRITIKGRVASLLEVGTGFHPELTGRENIFLNGAILGMTRIEIKRKFDEIVAFAEVQRFLDTPVKRYSSGMYVRLAFAVAAHLEPEILVVDEVLAVGDQQFQNKCIGKMREVARSGGRTVLFVSHNMQAISTLTRKCIVLSRGLCTFAGETGSAIRHYLNDALSVESLYVDKPSPTEPKVTRVEVRTTEPNSVQTHGEPMEVRLQISTPVPVRGAWLSFQIVSDLQQPFVQLWTSDSENPMCREPGVYQLVCRIPKTRLYLGKYTITLYLSEPPGGRLFQVIEGICPFEVVMHGYYREYRWEPGSCAYLEDCNWEPVQRLTQLSLGAAQLAQV